MFQFTFSLLLQVFLACSPTLPPSTPAVAPAPTGYGWPDSTLVHALAAWRSHHAPEKIYLHLDRTLFAPGETIWFCAYVRDAGSLGPATNSGFLYFELYDPQGNLVFRRSFSVVAGRAAGAYDLPAGAAGGLYRLRAYTGWGLNQAYAFERTVTVQNVTLPNLNLLLEFERKAHGPGDVVIARFDGRRLDNRPLAAQALRFTVSLDGAAHTAGECRTDENGRAYLRFSLPDSLRSADGLLNVSTVYEGRTEAISRAVPITLNRIDLQFFAEGGDAVAGLPTRMAFKAVDEFGKPADVSGEVVDTKGAVVGAFSSFHNGMGAFDFTPRAGELYRARLLRPVATPAQYELPAARAKGTILRLAARSELYLTFEITTTVPGTFRLAAVHRDAMVADRIVMVGQWPVKVLVPIAALAPGIVRVTLFELESADPRIFKSPNPVAERLAFVHRDRGLHIDITPERERYLPRERVRLHLRVRDDAGRPVPGPLSLAVVDETLLSFANDKQGQLLASLLLAQDVRGTVDEPDFYFDKTEEKAGAALDYLLMTQGWRRFSWSDALQNNFAPQTHAAERNRLDGTISAARTRQPVARQPVYLMPAGRMAITDDHGRFFFDHVDYTQPVYLKADTNVTFYTGSPGAKSRDISDWKPGGSALYGAVRDDTGEPLIGATVKVLRDGQVLRGTITDTDGNYRISLPPGRYTVEVSYTGFTTDRTTDVEVTGGAIRFLDIMMLSNNVITEVVITAYKVPLIEQDRTTSGQTVSVGSRGGSSGRRAKPAPAAPTAKASKRAMADNRIALPRANTSAANIDGLRLPVGSIAADMAAAPPATPIVAYNGPGSTIWPIAGPAPVRQFYAPVYGSDTVPAGLRNDFRKTVYWNPAVQADENGQAMVEFYASDAVSNFRVTAEGISTMGQAGHGETRFFVEKPVSVAVTVPPYVIVGDTLRLQVAVKNRQALPVTGLLEYQGPAHFRLSRVINSAVAGPDAQSDLFVEAGRTSLVTYEIIVEKTLADENGTIAFIFRIPDGPEDALEMPIRTLDRGFPVRQVFGGVAAQNVFEIGLGAPVDGTLRAQVTAFPGVLEQLLDGLEAMLRQPNGCFEQVSSSNYPNVLVLNLLRESGRTRPEIELQAHTLLDAGYQKLAGYECKTGGFDWWGREPAHEGLTAYGILQFTDMARVYPGVDRGLITRAVDWLKTRRDGQGGWKRRSDEHGWQADGVLGAYLAWALSETDHADLFRPEIEAAYAVAQKSGDTYQLVLLANALLAARDARADALIDELLRRQGKDGSWTSSGHSIMYGTGPSLTIETTGLAVLALIRSGHPQAAVAIKRGVDLLSASRRPYGYGSTQATVMALKALVAFLRYSSPAQAGGRLAVLVDGRRVAETAYSPDQGNNIEIAGLEQYVQGLQARVEVLFEGGGRPLPFALELAYAAREPQSAADTPLAFDLALSRPTARVGETVRLTAELRNTDREQPAASPMIVLGIPAGLALQPWQLKQLVEQKRCDYYELWDGFLVLHFERLAPSEARRIDLDLRAEVAGTFEAPASRAFLYYAPEKEVWNKPSRIKVED